jgi:hypothetical protein
MYNLICFIATAQLNVTIKTPKGTNIAALDYIYLYNGDYTQTEWESEDNYWLTYGNVDSSEVTLLAHSSLGYNCHSYAWHVSEGGNTVWVNDIDGNHNDIDNVNKYWDDGSYVETTQANHRKVFYHPETQFDHSAVTTSQTGWFISKWTNGPLVRHKYDNCPYWHSLVDLTYYKLSNPTISGSTDALCNNVQRTLSSDIIDANFTYDWNYTSQLDEVSDDDESTYTVEGTANSGTATVSLSVSTPSGVTVSSNKYFYVGEASPSNFTFSCYDNYGSSVGYGSNFDLCDGERYTFHVDQLYGSSASNHPYGISEVDFMFDFDYDEVTGGFGWICIDVIDVSDNQTGFIDITSDCGGYDDEWKLMNIGEDNCGGGGYYMALSPNPSSTQVTLSIETERGDATSLKSASTADAFDDNEEWEYEVYSSMQSLKAKKTKLRGKSTTLNTQSWQEGVYTVRVKYKNKGVTAKLVVKR